MSTELELHAKLTALSEYVSRQIKVDAINVGELSLSREGLQGAFVVRRRQAMATVIMAPISGEDVIIEILPNFSATDRKRWRSVDAELLVHLEATAVVWKKMSQQPRDTVQVIPGPLIPELWTLPAPQLDALISTCEQLPDMRAVAYTELHVAIESRAATWWFTRPGQVVKSELSYAARTQGSFFSSWRHRACNREIQNCLVKFGSQRIR